MEGIPSPKAREKRVIEHGARRRLWLLLYRLHFLEEDYTMYPKDLGVTVLAPSWECVAAPPGRLVILIAIALLSLALGCDAQSSRPTHGTSTGTGAGPQALFDPSTPLGKGQEVHLTGRIEFHDPD